MNEIIQVFNDQYNESMRNPAKTLDGHISNENGITNDYRGRAIFEFFQNSIDRAESKVWINLNKEKGIFTIANDGESFSIIKGDRKYSDFESLCSINTSSKNQNESIGNKGVGFKSCWEYTQKVTVCSIHENMKWGFNLHNPLRPDELKKFKYISVDIDEWLCKEEYNSVIERHKRLPSFYFPEIIDENEALVFFKIYSNATTIITFHDLSKESINELEKKSKISLINIYFSYSNLIN